MKILKHSMQAADFMVNLKLINRKNIFSKFNWLSKEIYCPK